MNTQPYGVYALDEQEVSDEELAQAWAELQEVNSYIETQIAACDFSAVAQEIDGYPVNGLAQFFAVVAIWAALHVDCLCEEMDSPDNYGAWYAAIDAHRARVKAVVNDEDCF